VYLKLIKKKGDEGEFLSETNLKAYEMPMVNAIIIGHQDSYKALGFGMLAHGFG
jgi:hypothetical protein